MIAKRFRILYLPEDTSTGKQFTWTRVRFFALAGSIAVAAVILVIGLGVIAARLTESADQRSLRRENNMLMKEISDLRYGIDELKSSMASLEQTDKTLRIIADLPVLSPDIREVGVGGAVSLDLFRADDPAGELRVDLDKLEREIKLQRDSFSEIEQRLERNQDLVLHTPSIWPVDGGRLTANYGKRRDPFTYRISPHYGIDIAAARGTRVFAAADGVVKEVQRKYAFGKVVAIDHGYGFETVYCHLNSFIVKPGQKVKRGDFIATVGNTGRSTGPHLHYEVMINDQPVNPLDYMFEGYALAR